jgi:hypothetical protein
MNACFAGHKELFPEAAVNKGSSNINGNVDMKAKWKWAKDQCLKRGPPYECRGSYHLSSDNKYLKRYCS